MAFFGKYSVLTIGLKLKMYVFEMKTCKRGGGSGDVFF